MAPTEVTLIVILTFLIGLLAASAWPAFAVLIGGLLISVLLGHALRRYRHAHWSIIVILGACFTLGFIYARFSFEFTRLSYRVPTSHTFTAFGIIAQEPRTPKDTYHELSVDLETPYAGRVRVLTSPRENFRYGDRILLTGKAELAEPPGRPIFLFPTIRSVERDRGQPLFHMLFAFKEKCLAAFPRVLPSEEAAFLAGLTLGETTDFSETLKADFKQAGATHLVALSGYNIGILIYAIGRTLGRYLSRRLTFLVTLSIIALFVAMVGAEASVVRAAIMGALTLFATYSGRRMFFLNVIVGAALLMALVDPTILRHNIGFQLSFLSVLGITYLGPTLGRLFRLKGTSTDNHFGWREQFLTTTSAQLAVLPVIAHSFGGFPVTALMANLLILPLIPATMFLGFVLIGTALFVPLVTVVVGWLVHIPLAYELSVIRFFSVYSVPLYNIFSDQLTIALYYGLLGLLIFKLYPTHQTT